MFERLKSDEYPSRFADYVDLVPAGDVLETLRTQLRESLALFESIGEEGSLCAYASGKWTVREVLGHINDTERIFCYRALRFARGDGTELPGFEQDDYVAGTNFNTRSFKGLCEEFRLIRLASLALFESLTAEELRRRGVASGFGFSVRAIASIIAGHELHHRQVIREKYIHGL